MTNVFIFHGTAGHPEENWFPWLKKKLKPLGYNVIIPQFPTPDNQTPETWFKIFRKYEKDLDGNTILIGHSLGGLFMLHVLEKSPVQIKAAFSISAPIGIMPIKNYKTDKPFLDHILDFEKIRKNCGKFFVFHSDNDPFVALENGQELAKKLNTELILVPNAGHFNTSAGYTEFDLLFGKIIGIYLKARVLYK